MSTTQAKTQVIGKEKRVSSSSSPPPFVRPQLGNVAKPSNLSKPVISIANSRTPKPTTTSLKPSSTTNLRTPKPTTTIKTALKPSSTALKPSSTANSRTPKPTTTAATALKSSSTVSPKPLKTASTIKTTNKTLTATTTTTRNVEKSPTLNRRGSLNNAPSSVRIQRSLSTAKTTVGEKLVKLKSAPSLETIDKSVPKSQTRKPEDDNVMQTEPERISSDNQDVSVLSDATVNSIEDDYSNQNCIDNDCLDKTIQHKRDETEIHQFNIEKHSHLPHKDDENENKTETTIDQSSDKQEVVESFLKASEIRRRMEAQVGSNEAVTPRWQVVRDGGNSVFNRKEMVSPVSNEVIEETTSKLIRENKKNKVLAMVGAFETVISNQQGNE